jgi:hypothetical protein
MRWAGNVVSIEIIVFSAVTQFRSVLSLFLKVRSRTGLGGQDVTERKLKVK